MEDTELINKALEKMSQKLTDMMHEDFRIKRKFYLAQCLRWHPDKNVAKNKIFAKKVFQLLQEKKDWFLNANA